MIDILTTLIVYFILAIIVLVLMYRFVEIGIGKENMKKIGRKLYERFYKKGTESNN